MEFSHDPNSIRIYGENEALLAEVTFPVVSENTVVVDHTFVHPSLVGRGVAGQLMQEFTTALRRTGRKARLTCSYAVAWFAKHPDCQDVLVEDAST